MTPNPSHSRPTLLLVHGAWHSAAHWSRVAEALGAAGRRAVAMDLPGCGARAALPDAYLSQDLASLAREVSPIAHITLEDQAGAIVQAVLEQRVHGPVIVVAHSAGGLPATAAVERVPEQVARIVYVAAHCPVAFPNLLGYLGLPESADARLAPAFIGNPEGIGAVRINPRAADAAYQALLLDGLYHDLDPVEARAFIACLTPDLPLRVAVDDVHVTPQRWGRVPRSYVRTLADRALPPALQNRMIAEADALTPDNLFEVYSLASGHSPFASCPDALAALLCRLS